MTPPVRRVRERGVEAPAPSTSWILAGRAFVRGRLQPVEVAISEEGTIASIGKVRAGAPRHDVGDAIILPSATDLHVHFREPGGPDEVETIESGTTQAALGGICLVGEMPNTSPPVTDADVLANKAARVEARASVDVLLYGSPTNPRALPSLAARAGAFKLYLSPTTGIPDVADPSSLAPLLSRLEGFGLPVAVHAEDPTRFSAAIEPEDPRGWDSARPPSAEEAAVDRLLRDAPLALRLHVAHVTIGRSVERLRKAGVSFEATPHHLLLSERSGRDARTKVNPPLRSERHRRELWDAFVRGEVPCLASDHAPHSSAAKQLPFPRAPSGVPGVQTMLPLLLAKVRSGEIGLPTLTAAACDRPARWFGQPHGRLAPGHRAHLLVVDFRQRTRLEARRLRAPCGWTPFEGMEAIFPQEHYLYGRPVVAGGEFVGGSGGRVVRPEYAPGRS